MIDGRITAIAAQLRVLTADNENMENGPHGRGVEEE